MSVIVTRQSFWAMSEIAYSLFRHQCFLPGPNIDHITTAKTKIITSEISILTFGSIRVLGEELIVEQ